MANLIEKMGLEQEHMTIEVFPHVPRAMGLGGSSALAVAIVRAEARTYEPQRCKPKSMPWPLNVNRRRPMSEASGVDNTVTTYSTPLCYQRQSDEPRFETVNLGQPLELVIGMTGKEILTAETVARVRRS